MQEARRVYPGVPTGPGIDGMTFFPLRCCPLHVTAKFFNADCFHPSTTSEKKTINAPGVLIELDPPAHPMGTKRVEMAEMGLEGGSS